MPTTIQIFRPGRHTAMSGEAIAFGEGEVAAIAAGYDPAIHEAPAVLGHPRHDAPAYGWVRALQFADGALSAELDQLDPAFREAVQAGRYKKVSASFYRPDAPANPKPGQYYLRHVGFLGAEVPAVKGLAPVNLADGAGDVVTVDFGEAASDTPAPSPTQTETQPVPEAPTDPDLARRLAEVEAREAALRQRERERQRADNAAFLEGLVAEGRPLPADRDSLLAFMDGLTEAGTISFGEGKEPRPALAFFKDQILASLPRQVAFGEAAPATTPDLDDDPVSIARQAVAYRETQRRDGVEISTATAVLHITGQHKDPAA